MTLPACLQPLLDAATYPHPCAQIRCLETHISWVILTGDYAYKVRKPVDFGFLDFSTLALRRQDCEEELRLNRRLAPDLYYSVVAIRQHQTGLQVNLIDEHQPDCLEYAVQMRQFDNQSRLDVLQERGALTDALITRIAAYLADFHQQAARATSEQPWGELEAILSPVEQNFAQLGQRLIEEADQTLLRELQHWSLEQFERHRETFLQRKAEGWIREGHGDLHLGNMVLFDQQPLAFDCLEFNASLRWIDVCNDLAFLVMDLEYRGQSVQATLLLNTWLEYTGDYAGVCLMPFYKVYRALVRAKVHGLRAAQLDDESQQTTAWEDCRQYLRYAGQLMRRNRPLLAITHGVSGTGKTTVARALATELGAIHLRSDVERKRLFGLAPLARSHSSLKTRLYSREASAQTFEHLLQQAELLLKASATVIVDATFLHVHARSLFLVLAQRLGVPFVIVDCALDEQSVRDRLQARCARGEDASEATVAIMEQQVQDQDYLSQQEQQYVVRFDTRQALAPQVQTACARFQRMHDAQNQK